MDDECDDDALALYAHFNIRREVARIAEALTDGEEEAEDESDE